MNAAVLELLPDGTGRLRGAGRLQLDDLNEVGNAAQVIFLIGFTGQPLDSDGNGRIGFLL